MLVLLNKYLLGNKDRAGNDEGSSRAKHRGMPPAGSNNSGDHHHMCIPGCVPAVRASKRSSSASAAAAAATTTVTTTTTTTARASRHNFVKAAASGLLAGVQFTNHESLPALPDAYAEFAAAFPQYGALARADAVREAEYAHLDRHVCMDYTGINLFSHAQMNSSLPSTSSLSSAVWQPPFFDIAYKSTSLRTQLQQCGANGRRGGSAAAIGPAIRRRIMASLKISGDEYTMVPTANRTTAFRLLAESYSFRSSSSSSSSTGGTGGGGKHLLSVYDYESEAALALSDAARRRGAHVASATFAWPSMRIHAADLRKKLAKGRSKRRGLFVFPLASRMTGARYPYLWMSAAQERGWHVALDACAMGTKDLDTLGVSLLRPDFIVCNFFKVFGENPSGFAGLFVKKTSLPALERSVIARSIGIVSIVPARRWSLHVRNDDDDDENGNGYSTELDRSRSFTNNQTRVDEVGDDVDTSASFSGPLSATVSRILTQPDVAVSGEDEIQEVVETAETEPAASAANVIDDDDETEEQQKQSNETDMVVECRGLDHADALGLIGIGNRLRCLTNWLVVALQKLRHPSTDHGHALVRVYGPRVKFERGPSLAFNVFDWKGERVAPPLVQKLADRHGISLTCGFLRNIWFADKYEADRAVVLDHRTAAGSADAAAVSKKASRSSSKQEAAGDVGVFLVNASLGFLSNFEDAYRLWAFVAKFLDADFVEKERWRYTALNQKTVEV